MPSQAKRSRKQALAGVNVLEALGALAREKGLSEQALLHSVEEALLAAYHRTPGAAPFARAEISDSGEFIIYRLILPAELRQRLEAEAEEEELPVDPETGEARLRPKLRVPDEALAEYRDQIREIDDTPEDFGRIAAHAARQALLRHLRNETADQLYEEYLERINELAHGVITQARGQEVLVSLGENIEGVLPRYEQIPGEHLRSGARVKAIIKEVLRQSSGTRIVLSRRDPAFVAALVGEEVPEIADGHVQIVRVTREAGQRAKIGVISPNSSVDPVGACIGPRGARIRTVVSQLAGERVDVIALDRDTVAALAKALGPAKVREVIINEDETVATAIVADEDVPLAIGHHGTNVRLASLLLNMEIEVIGQSAASSYQQEEEEQQTMDHRCAAFLDSGRRCPNAPLEGSLYCGLEAHQALAEGSEESSS